MEGAPEFGVHSSFARASAVLTFFFTVFVRTFSQMVRIAIGQARKEAAAQKNVIKFFALISMPLLLSREYNFLPTQDSGHCMA